jgi:hypothetical protein
VAEALADLGTELIVKPMAIPAEQDIGDKLLPRLSVRHMAAIRPDPASLLRWAPR